MTGLLFHTLEIRRTEVALPMSHPLWLSGRIQLRGQELNRAYVRVPEFDPALGIHQESAGRSPGDPAEQAIGVEGLAFVVNRHWKRNGLEFMDARFPGA